MTFKPIMLKNETFVVTLRIIPLLFLEKRSLYLTNKNMKEDQKSMKQSTTYINRAVHHPFPKPDLKRQSPRIWGCDTENQENKLACAGRLPEKLPHDSWTYLLNSRDSASPQTEHPSSKYKVFFFFLRFFRTMKQWSKLCSAGISA